MSLNKVMLIGNVGKDPEIRSANGVQVASFPIATTEVFSSKAGQRQEHTEWHNIVVWRGLADVVEKYVKKGTPLYVEGRIRNRSYDGKDGVKHYITEILCDNLRLLGRKEATNGAPTQEYAAPKSPDVSQEPPSDADDLPF
ncbi:single-stranded DNA-binding protein [Williamwhitmania taraxaci]|uniref:Single-stranded DNA-binding protein n=1 Tax=Williamwhitmania taraxaci TaxID=1640674 RepID=A0A1G6HF62_9BACT|nr:single-stranded DNA-binding protein [Williamwhitmania taraxaci]SDB92086.1 single-strand binding protein [Williamwhitmania taraxaci]